MLPLYLKTDEPIDTGHVFYSQQNVAQNIEVAARYNKMFMMHVNDNYNLWDDDLIAGSLRYIR